MAKKLLLLLIVCGGALLLAGSAHAATLYFSPGSSSYSEGQTFSVSLRVDTEGQAINAIQTSLGFPTNVLEVTSVSKSSSILTLWVSDPSYSNANGTVTLSGGVPSPGYTGSGGIVVVVSFRAKSAGTGTVSVVSGVVLANDGFGTNVYRASSSGTYTVAEPVEPPPAPNTPAAPTVSSTTHPDQSAWYANTSPIFQWTRPSGTLGFSYSFDDQQGTVPDTIEESNGTQESFSGIGDNVWYFHVRARNDDGWGATGHFKTQIDTTPPESFTVSVAGSGSSRELTFEATDALSGVHHYDVSFDGATAIGVNVGETTPYTTPELSSGQHRVLVTAVDYAGNRTDSTATFSVSVPKPNPPVLVINEEDKPDAIIVNTINTILPKPVRQITDQVGQVISKLKQNEDVTKVINDVVTPVVTTTAVVTATGVAATVTALQLSNVIYLFLRLSYLWFVPVAVGKRRKPWGVVFDSTTNQPLRRAIVRLFSKEFNKLKETQITDREGRFGFLVEQGKFFVTVERAGYTFPSQILKSASATPFDQVYLGDTIEVKDPTAQSLAINIPIDPDQRDIPRGRVLWIRLLNNIGTWLERLSLPLLIIGTLASWVTLIIQPETNNYLFLMVYGLLIVMKYLVSHHYERSWGTVIDAQTNEPIELGVVRIYNVRTGTVVGTRVTNASGLFQALVAPGKYYIMVVKSGYQPFQSKPIVVSRERGVIRMTVKLHKKAATGEQQPESTGSIELEEMRGEQSVFTPPPQQPVAEKPAPTPPQPAEPASDSPFAPPEQHEVEKREDSFAPKPEKKEEDSATEGGEQKSS